MNFKRVLLVASIILLLGGISFSNKGICAQPENVILAKKTLNRWVDPVVMKGKLAKEMAGVPLSSLRLYAFRNGTFAPIRYQIDEMTEEGDWIYPDGPLPNGELSNGKFDDWDKIVFMADDIGDRVGREAWTPGYIKGEEIEVIDPLTGGKGWCYLLCFASSPPQPSNLPDYVHFDYKNGILTTDYWEQLNLRTKDGTLTAFPKSYKFSQLAGGNNKNFIDRLKVRPTVKLMFGSLTIHFTEELVKSKVLAYKQGPVRLLPRAEQYTLLPGGIKAMRAVTDVVLYRNISSAPVLFQIPFRMETIVSSFIVRAGTDYNENAIGSKIYNSENIQGFLVDGRMDENELQKFNPAFDKWRMISGDVGTFMSRTIPTPEAKNHVKISMGYLDDTTHKAPPETYPGEIGHLWQAWDVGQAPKGKYYIFLENYCLPHYKPGDEIQYMNYTDHPVKIRADNLEEPNLLFVIATLSKKYN